MAEQIETPKVVQDDQTEMTLFYPKQDGSGLAQAKVKVDDWKKNPTMWMKKMIELLSTPSSGEVAAVFPDKVDLYALFTDKEMMYVDFSANLQKLQFTNIQIQQLALQAFLSSLKANFPYARQVKFLVEHEDREVIFGHIYASQPFTL